MQLRRHQANAVPARGDDPTTGIGPASGWRGNPLQPDIDPADLAALARTWEAIVSALHPLREVTATEDVPAAEWDPYFSAIPNDGQPRRLIGAFPTRRSVTMMNPATATVNVWLARDASLLQTAVAQATLGTQPIPGVLLLAPGMSIAQTHRLEVFAAVPSSAAGVGIVTGWVEGSARQRQVPWEAPTPAERHA